MTECYVVTSASGEVVIRTNSKHEADHYSSILRGKIIDLREQQEN